MTALQKETPVMWNETGNRRGELLARLSTDPRSLATRLQLLPSTVEARLSAFLTEIDEIVLPRVLHLHSGSRQVASLTVSHRRLIGIDMPGRSAVPGDAKDLPDLFAARLVEIAETRGDFLLTVGRRPSHPNHAETACSVAALNQALALATTQNAFDRLLSQAGTQSIAQLVWSGTGTQPQFSGAPDWAVPLQRFANNYRAMATDHPADARVGPLRTEGLVIPLTAGRVLVIASLESRGFAVVLARQIGLELVASWQMH